MALDIHFEKVKQVYQPNSPFKFRALTDITLTIPEGNITAFIGHTGSGKSTLLQHLNALMKPTNGFVKIGEKKILPQTKDKNLKTVRKKVGMVFQFPESQLFEETIIKDVAFGPQNFGLSKQEAEKKAAEALRHVDIAENLWNHSPFELSGGQMRRVAIAGVLAMSPEVLVLDEPTTGLDPKGRCEIMEIFQHLHQEKNVSLILVTHLMDHVAQFADFVHILEKGKIIKSGTPAEVFANTAWLKEKQLSLPNAALLSLKLQKKGILLNPLPLTMEKLVEELTQKLSQEEANE